MNCNWLAKPVTRLLKSIRSDLSKPRWGHMLTMIIGTILAPRISNLTAITKATKRKKGHRTSLGRFLVAKGLDTFGLLMRLSMGVLAHTLKFLSEQKNLPIYLIIDSTIQERASLNVAGSQVIRLSGGSYGPGQLLMVGVVRVGQFTLPFWIEPVFNKHWAKVLKRPRRTQIQIAEEMIRTFLPSAEMEVIVLFDSFFSAQKVLKACEARGFTFVTNLKSNRNVLAHRNQNQVGKYAANVPSRNHKAYVFGRQTFLAATRDSAIKGFGKIRVVFSRKVGHKRIYHLATNDTTASIKEIIGHYLRRWAIETFFKDVKQPPWNGRLSSSHAGRRDKLCPLRIHGPPPPHFSSIGKDENRKDRNETCFVPR